MLSCYNLMEYHCVLCTKISIASLCSYWYRWWDSNPHGFPHDFESCASTNSATSAFANNILTQTKKKVYILFEIYKRKIFNCRIFIAFFP